MVKYERKSSLFRFQCDFKSLPLPEEGIETNEGHLFHHVLPLIVKKEHSKRLNEFGVKYTRAAFYAEEDEILEENVTAFFEENKLGIEQARYFVGFLPGKREWFKESDEFSKRMIELNMWPKLCNGLENRSAYQVQERIVDMFDPYADKADSIGETEESNVDRLLKQGMTPIEVSHQLKVPFSYVHRRKYPQTDMFKKRTEETQLSHEEIPFVKCVSKSVLPDADVLSWGSIDIDRLCERLRRVGLVKLADEITRERSRTHRAFIRLYNHLMRWDEVIFQHLVPQPSIREKLMLFYEGMAVEAKRKTFDRYKYKFGILTSEVLFNVVDSYYTKKYIWTVPSALTKYKRWSDNSTSSIKHDETTVIRKRRYEDAVASKGLSVRILSSYVKNPWKIRRKFNFSPEESINQPSTSNASILENDENYASDEGESTFLTVSSNNSLDETTMSTAQNTTKNTNISYDESLAVDETVLAGGGKAWNNVVESRKNASGVSEIDRYSSLILDTSMTSPPVQPKIEKMVEPKSQATDWLSLLG